MQHPILSVRNLERRYGERVGCTAVGFDLWPGEVLAVVGEAGCGKTTLLNCVAGRRTPTSGAVGYRMTDGTMCDRSGLGEADHRRSTRVDWGFLHQNPVDGLRMGTSAGANIAERLMAGGERDYGRVRGLAAAWLSRVGLPLGCIDAPASALAEDERRRLQLARIFAGQPRLVFLDEPTGQLHDSARAALLATLHGLVTDSGVTALVATRGADVARLTASRMMVMADGRIVEEGPPARLLDHPSHPETRRLLAGLDRSSGAPDASGT